MEIHIDNKEKFVLAKIISIEKGQQDNSEFVKVFGEITHADEKQHENKLNWKKIDIYFDKDELSKIIHK